MTGGTQPTARVVIVDDSRLIREMARDALGGRVLLECCVDAEEALEALDREPADLVISDLSMPGMSGIDLLERVRLEHPGTAFVLLTANATVESAIGALRMGASDYLIKPVQPENLVVIVERVIAQRRLLEENERLRDTLATVESCRTLLRCLDPSELYAVVLDLMLNLLPRERGLALFRRGSIPISDGFAFRGFDEDDAERLRDVLVHEKPVNLDSVLEVRVVSESDLHRSLRALGNEAGPAVVVPLRGRQTELGLLWIFEDGRPFEAVEIERIRLIAGHAQLALQNAERYDHAQERAFVDDVTEAYNARYLLRATEHEIQRAERYGKQLSVLFLDLDRFKLDRHGCGGRARDRRAHPGDGGRDALRRRPRFADPPRDQHRCSDLSRTQQRARCPPGLCRQGDVPRQIARPQSRLLRLGARGVTPGGFLAGPLRGRRRPRAALGNPHRSLLHNPLI
jgi:DNA-binding NarL/FixJ family response regulator